MEYRLTNFLPFNDAEFPLKLHICGIKQCTGQGDGHVRRDSFNLYSIEYVFNGQGTLRIGGTTCRPAAGDAIILQKGYAHEFFPDPQRPWGKIHIHCYGLLVDELMLSYRLANVFHVPGCQLEAEFLRVIDLPSRQTTGVPQNAAVLIHEILMKVAQRRGLDSEHQLSDSVRRLKDQLDLSPERRLSLDEMAILAGRSPSQTIRLFKAELGCTPYDYHLRQKIELAAALIMSGDLSIGDVAERVGFASPYHFSNAFKKRMGVSPIKYRERMLEAKAP